jgi:hypothetical protein
MIRKLIEQDLTAIIGTVHCGYTILKARIKVNDNFTDSDHYGIILAKRDDDEFVVWQFHIDLYEGVETTEIYWGKYTEWEKSALNDYETRD